MMLASIQNSQTRRTLLRVHTWRKTVSRACCEMLESRRLLSFSPAVNYATIGTPSAIVTADLNNDGKLDLVTCANAVTGSYSVFLGNGAGGFGAAQRTVMGTQLSSMAAADFNNDGKLDLVISDNYDYGFDFLAGKGDGTFQLPVFTQSGAVAAVGRFNGDLHTDVLVIRLGPDWETQLQVYCGNGQGGFTAAEPEIWYYGTGRAAVDLNNDGKLDVVTAEGYVFPGNGDGTFEFDWEQPALLPAGGEIATGDFTGDGKADAIVAGNNAVSVLRGRGDGTFDAPINHALAGNPHTGLATADFNGDGKLDALVSTYDTGAVRLMLGNGDGTLRDGGTFATGSEPSGVVAGDFNRDGRPDVAVSNAASRTVSVLLNDGVWAGTKTFVGPGGAGSGGNWSNASNWSPAGVPGAGDHVAIDGRSVSLGSGATVAGLALTGGATLSVTANGNRVLRTANLSIGGTSTLNLNDNDLILDYSGGVAASPVGSWNGASYTGVSGLVARGYTYGDWSGGDGLVTTMPQARAGVTTLAVADAARLLGLTGNQTVTFGGQTVDATTVLVKYTYAGDVNLDGVVDGADYGTLDNWIQFPGTAGYMNGDVNFDGVIDGADYGMLDNSIQLQGPPL